MLKLSNVSKVFDGVEAVRNVEVEFKPGKVYALIGPNGAGKTTLLNLINGFITPTKGKIFIKGEDVTGKPAYQIARMGVGRLFQDIRVLPKMKVLDNLLIAKPFDSEENPLVVLTKIRSNKEKERVYHKEGEKYLKEFGIDSKESSFAEDLSFGQEKLLSIARLLMGDFEILLLDEPVAGVNPRIKSIIYKKIKEITSMGKLVIIVEHEMEAVRRAADYVFFMNNGEIMAEGEPEKVLGSNKVIEEYIGLSAVSPLQSTGEKKEVILKAKDIHAAYYKRHVLNGVSIELREGEVVGLIGPNGAGKSTLLKVLAGILPAKNGKIFYRENGDFRDITHLSCKDRVKKGIGYFIQGGEIFTDLSVEENLDISAINMDKGQREEQKKMIFDLFPVIKGKRRIRAGLLSGGERQMLALSMILMRRNRVLLWLDEPSAGLAPKYAQEMLSKIKKIRNEFQTSILLVEQRVDMALENSDRLYIMNMGEIVKEVLPNQIEREEIEAIYMGNHNN